MKLAIITGGSKGLGKALADLCAAQGWQTLDLSRSGSGGEGHLTVDLGQIDGAMPSVEAKFAQLARQPWQHVALVNNAGVLPPIGPLKGLDDGAIQTNLNINVNAAVRIIACFARHFDGVAARKTVANVSSGAANRGMPGWSLYCGAKAGLENFIRALAAEQVGNAHPMQCFNFAPGVVDTGMQANIRDASPQQFPDVANFVKMKEAGQLRTPESVAATLFKLLAGQPENGRRYSVEEFD